MKVALVWLSLDLRIADNPALEQAITNGCAIIPVFIWAPEEDSPWQPGAVSRWWLHQSLLELDASLKALGSKLIIRRGPTVATLLAITSETAATSIYWNRRYEPASIAREREVEVNKHSYSISVVTCAGNVLFEPGTVLSSSGKPFQVFTAFHRAAMERSIAEPTSAPRKIPAPPEWPASESIASLSLEPEIDWAAGLRETWKPGEASAARQLEKFATQDVSMYSVGRDRPDRTDTSRLSPHLHFGEISARQIWQSVHDDAYRRQLVWREFSYHLLFHFPHTASQPLRREFNRFPWRVDAKGLNAWTRGETGYPLVDAGMRELWRTGWMHNRVRMLVASFLVKHLMIQWQEGAAWFWDTLVDADLANNTMGWQWSAGCGADAAPYFRIFNPTLQREKFDPDGEYVRRWITEAAIDYPRPIIEHKFARERALAAFAAMRNPQQ